MIFEMQNYTLKSRSQALVEERFKKALPGRVRLSPLGAFWHTEVGVLNQIIVVWPYANPAERDRILAEEPKVEGWPPAIDEFVVERQSRILVPAPFSPQLEPRRLGNLYEIRTYTYPADSIAEVIGSWSEIIGERMKYSPLVAAWYSETRPLSEWVHIWAYQNAGERERIREATAKAGVWPISVVDRRLKREPRAVSLRMQNMLVVPASFSPLR
jgi:NIPSNAP